MTNLRLFSHPFVRGTLSLVLLVWSVCASASTTLYLTRHYEKLGEGQNPGLTSTGQARAQALAMVLLDKNVKAIYSTQYQRTIQTAMPLSEALQLPMNFYEPQALVALAEDLRKNQTSALVVGHSNTTPELIRLLGGPVFTIEEDDYGTLFELTLEPGQTTVHLRQIPQSEGQNPP